MEIIHLYATLVTTKNPNPCHGSREQVVQGAHYHYLPNESGNAVVHPKQ